jgi:hypothetical protein
VKKKLFIWVGSISLIVLLLMAIFYAGQAMARSQPARAQAGLSESMPNLPNSPDYSTHLCYVNNVAAFETRIHIRCSNPTAAGIAYFAYPTDAAHAVTANQILAIGNSAFALGADVWMYYNLDSAYNPPGCNTSDCRGLVGVSMVP